jgi:hypothetical protein
MSTGSSLVKNFYIPLYLFVLLFLSCQKQEPASPIIMSVYPEDVTTIGDSGSLLEFHITTQVENELERITIDQKDNLNGLSTLLDSNLTGKSLDLIYFYKIPSVPDLSIVELVFTAFSGNEQLAISRKVKIYNELQLLSESTGHVLYSALSGNTSGFNLNLRQAILVDYYDNEYIDFADMSVDSIHGNALSNSWYSPAECKFVRFQGFNYPEATNEMLQDSYNYGIKENIIQNISPNDIIIIGRGDIAKAVIYIVNVLDNDTTLNDRYFLNIKL